jgi:choline-sulfatase
MYKKPIAQPRKRRGRLTRGQLLKSAAVAAPGLMYARNPLAALARNPGGSVDGMNVIVFLTDQERAIQHFPRGWAKDNLPGLTRLQRHGLTFENAFTNACMCSPARSTFVSGFFPAQHGVKYTLEEDMPADQYPQVQLPLDFKNIASVMSAAGYNVVYKGKWHLSKPMNGSTFTPADAAQYGFQRWDPPDAGANQDLDQAGGGSVNADGRYIESVGDVQDGTEGALQYLSGEAAKQQPFCMIISLVNPHDVLFYPSNYAAAGYDNAWLNGEIGLPATTDEDLSTKPSVQKQFLRLFQIGGGPITTPDMKRKYLNFYANLMKSSDGYLVQVLDKLTSTGLLDNTLIIRTADHGEMGLAHGGLRQKNFNFYEEALRVPLVYSNPKLYDYPCKSGALVSHVDFLPTLASLFHAPASARTNWQGVDYSAKVENPREAKAPQRYIVFTYDDFQSGQANGPYPQPPNHIASIREARWKLAQYYDVNGNKPSQWEMYDLKADPLERQNLAAPGYERTPEQEKQYKRLRKKLAEVKKTRLQPLPS